LKVLLKKRLAPEPFSFSFVNNEGTIVLRSGNYKAKDSALKGIHAVIKHCVEDKRYLLKESANGKFFFNIKSSNGQVVATSAMYSSVEDRNDAIAYVKSSSPDCMIDEIIT